MDEFQTRLNREAKETFRVIHNRQLLFNEMKDITVGELEYSKEQRIDNLVEFFNNSKNLNIVKVLAGNQFLTINFARTIRPDNDMVKYINFIDSLDDAQINQFKDYVEGISKEKCIPLIKHMISRGGKNLILERLNKLQFLAKNKAFNPKTSNVSVFDKLSFIWNIELYKVAIYLKNKYGELKTNNLFYSKVSSIIKNSMNKDKTTANTDYGSIIIIKIENSFLLYKNHNIYTEGLQLSQNDNIPFVENGTLSDASLLFDIDNVRHVNLFGVVCNIILDI